MRRLVLVLLLLVACERVSPGAAGPELVLWHSYRGDERAALEAVVARYQSANPGTHVRLVAIPYDAFADKLGVAVPGGRGPDLFIYAHDRLGDWAERRFIEPLGFWADEAQIDRFHLATVEPLVYHDELYALPLAFKTLALYFDRSLISTPPKTTDDLIRLAKGARARDPSVWGLGYEVDSLYFHAPWLYGFGGSVYVGDSDELALDRPEAAASVAFVRRLLREERIIPEECTSNLVTSLFKAHKLAFVVSGPWFRGGLAGHGSWAVTTLPVVSETGLRARPFLGVEGVFLSRRSRFKREAFRFMKHLTSDDAAALRLARGGQLVANRAVYERPEVAKDAFFKAFFAQLTFTAPLSNRPHMRRVWTPAKDALAAAILHGESPARALAEAVSRIKRSGE